MEYGENIKITSIQIDMKDNMHMIKNMEKDNSHGCLVIYIKEVINWMKEMGMGRCILSMAQSTKVTGHVEYNVVKPK